MSTWMEEICCGLGCSISLSSRSFREGYVQPSGSHVSHDLVPLEEKDLLGSFASWFSRFTCSRIVHAKPHSSASWFSRLTCSGMGLHVVIGVWVGSSRSHRYASHYHRNRSSLIGVALLAVGYRIVLIVVSYKYDSTRGDRLSSSSSSGG